MSNILIIKHGSLGDIAQASGAIQDISENHKNSKIYLMTTKPYFELFKKNPYVNEVILDKRLPKYNLIYLYFLMRELKKYNFSKVFDIHAKTFDDLGFKKARMNACGYSLGNTFSPNWMDWPMLYTNNPYVIQPGNVFFMHMILMDSDNQLAMNLGETYLVTGDGNERLGNQKLDLVVL